MNTASECCAKPIADALQAQRDRQKVTEVSVWRENVDERCLARLASIRTLKFLELYRARVTDEHLTYLSALTRLRRLELAVNPDVTDAGLLHLAGLTKLEELSLKGCRQITDDGAAHLQTLTALKKLDLTATGITEGGLSHLEGQALEELSLPFAHTNCRLPVLIRNLRRFPRLRLVAFPPGRGWTDDPDAPVDAGLDDQDSRSARWIRRALPNCQIMMSL